MAWTVPKIQALLIRLRPMAKSPSGLNPDRGAYSSPRVPIEQNKSGVASGRH